MKYIIFSSLLFLTFSTLAAPVCSKNGTTIIYTNGVTTTRDDANIALGKIDALNLDSQIDLKKVNDSVLAYNYEESVAKDFLEAAVQRIPSIYLKKIGASNPYAAFSSFYYGTGLQLISFQLYLKTMEALSDNFAQSLNNYLLTQKNNPKYIQTVNEIKKHYTDAFARGERVFAISHSQGGLFMNDVYSLLDENDNKRKFFSGFQIASPLPKQMNSHFGYATHDRDNLINLVRSTVGALPANITAPSDLRNGISTAPSDEERLKDFIIEYFLNHGVMTTYLYDSTIRSQVISKLVTAAQLLESNCVKANIQYYRSNLDFEFYAGDPNKPRPKGLTYLWDFGDGQSATTQDALHSYASPGFYKVSLTVTGINGGTATAKTTVRATKPVISYNPPDNLHVDFTFWEPEAPGTIFTWYLGDNAPPIETTTRTLSYTYSSPGSYDVLVVATDSLGNDAEAENKVTVITAPVTPPPDVTPPSPAPLEEKIWYIQNDGSSIQVTGLTLFFPLGTDAVYNWDFGDGKTETTTYAGVAHRYDSTGVYKLTVNVAGRELSTTINIFVPILEILSQPTGEVPYGASWSYQLKCNIGERVIIDTTVINFKNGVQYGAENVFTCTGVGEIGVGINSNQTLHTITCTPKVLSCPYSFILQIYPTFYCAVVENGMVYPSNWVDGIPHLINYAIPAGCQ